MHNFFSDSSDYVLLVSKTFDFTPRCFAFNSLHGYFRFTEITSSAYSPEFVCPFPLLQKDLHDLSQPGKLLLLESISFYLVFPNFEF